MGQNKFKILRSPTAVAFLPAHSTRETRGVMFVFSPLARLLWWRWEALRQSVLRQRAVLAAAEGCGGCGCCGGGGGGKVWQGALRLLGAGIWRAYEGGPPNAKAAQHGAKSKKSKVRIVIARNRIDQIFLKKCELAAHTIPQWSPT